MPRKKNTPESAEGAFAELMRQRLELDMLRMMSPFGSRTSRLESAETPNPPSVDLAKLEALKVAEPYKVTARVPDYVEVITAWRAWDVKNHNGWRLEALGKSVVWEPKKQIEAACHPTPSASSSIFGSVAGRSSKHPAPHWDCNCGIWAFKDLDTLVAALGNKYTVQVLGQVSLWGRVIETENGFRAQYAYPSELWIFSKELEELGLIYDVPVRMA